ncbi:MAG: M56 family metallopeptidase, partial [Planctomycetaceae bacterium]|nr:M56 family metallopeptidase [Planctomycetaceae bacterium]
MNAYVAELLSTPANPAFVEQTGWVLFHSSWQFTVLAMLVAFVDYLMRRGSAAQRYLVQLAGLSLTILLPLMTWMLLPTVPAEIATAEPSVELSAHSSRKEPAQKSAESDLVAVETATVMSEIADVDSGNTSAVSAVAEAPVSRGPTVWDSIAASIEPWLPALVSCWHCGVLLFSLRLLLSWFTVWRLRTVGISPVEQRIEDCLRRLLQHLRIQRHVVIRQSALITAPIVVGCFRSIILLPVGLLAGMTTEQVEAIIAHELVHVRRYDFLVNLAQTIIETMFFYHPAVWWMSRRLRIERENCCDDEVVGILGNRLDYGRALLAIEENRRRQMTISVKLDEEPCDRGADGFADGGHRFSGQPLRSVRGGSLLSRVRRLLQPVGLRPSATLATWTSVIAVTSLVAGLMLGAVYAATSARQSDGFGPEVHGLQCRLVFLSPQATSDPTDFTQTVTEFADAREMTMGVELKNVSERSISLAAIRSQVDGDQGVLHSSAMSLWAPHLFELEFLDAQGQPVPRTQRQFLDR